MAQRDRRRWVRRRKQNGRSGETPRRKDEHVGVVSTSRQLRAAKQLRGRVRGSARESGACPPCCRSGRARDPHWITVALPYLLSFCFMRNSPKV